MHIVLDLQIIFYFVLKAEASWNTKIRIGETLTLLTDADSKTDAILIGNVICEKKTYYF